MILRNRFKEQLRTVGAVKKAWFTTFNFDVSFFEAYVLSTLLNADVPRNRRDFEAMQLAMNESTMDVRVFCDQRILDAGGSKKTAVKVHNVSHQALKDIGIGGAWGVKGLFHPKVIYIEGEDGACLGAGSANLTVSGWGRNREAFLFQNEWGIDQIEELRTFFTPLFALQGEDMPELQIPTGRPPAWSFVHSFQNRTFFEGLFPAPPRELKVMSPYFSSDLAALVDRIRRIAGNDSLSIGVIPDYNDEGLIRTERTVALDGELKRGYAQGGVTIYEMSDRDSKQQEMVHAKLWWTPDRVAIGSWNMTKPGTNTAGDDNNVEAGFVIPTPRTFWDVELREVDNWAGRLMTKEKMAAEKREFPPLPAFELRVEFDWAEYRYHVHYRAPVGTKDAKLVLPDLENPLLLAGITGEGEMSPIPVEKASELLRRRLYRAIDADGARLEGYIVERRAEMRPVLVHSDLAELLDSLLFGQFGNRNVRADYPKAIFIDDREDDEGNVDVEELGQPKEGIVVNLAEPRRGISYYRMFRAMKNLDSHLDSITDDKEFILNALTYPGSVRELVDKAGELSNGCGALSQATAVFKWFFLQEVNRLVRKTNKRLAEKGAHVAKIGTLPVSVLPKAGSDKARKAFIAYILKEYRCD